MVDKELGPIDAFQLVRDHGPLKYASIAFTIVAAAIFLPGMYGIIWYERYGTDLKRILLNMIVSSLSWVGIVWYAILQPLEIIRDRIHKKILHKCY